MLTYPYRWLTWALVFFIWIEPSPSTGNIQCEEKGNQAESVGCQIGQGVINFLVIMCQLVVLGSGFILLCSIGQGVSSHPFLAAIGACFVALMTIIPAFMPVELHLDQGELVDTSMAEDEYDYNKFTQCELVNKPFELVETFSQPAHKLKWNDFLLQMQLLRVDAY